MANIVINAKCNLRCEYCFAGEYIENNKDNYTKDQFVKTVDYITRIPNERVGIIGGEPTLHKDFEFFIRHLIENEKVSTVTLFTNGIELGDKLKLLSHPKIHMLINVNERRAIGESNYRKLKANLDEIFYEYNMGYKASLGLNVYRPDMDVEWFLSMAEQYGLKQVRVSIVVPKQKDVSAKEYFKRFLPVTARLMEGANKRKIGVGFDCNLIPICLMDDAMRALVKENEGYSKGRKYVSTDCCSSCTPVIDIAPDGTAMRCFGMSEKQKVNLFDFADMREVRAYFAKRYDSALTPPDKECADCRLFACGKCFAGCLAFRKDL